MRPPKFTKLYRLREPGSLIREGQIMSTRSTKSMVTFFHPFFLSGDTRKLPAGDYEVIVEEETLQGLSFFAYRKTATYLIVIGTGQNAGKPEKRKISGDDLEAMLSGDRAPPESLM